MIKLYIKDRGAYKLDLEYIIHLNENYTIITLSGIVNYKSTRTIASVIIDKWNETNFKPILIDGRKVLDAPSLVNDYLIIQKLKQLKGTGFLKIGILDLSDHITHNNRLELVAAFEDIKVKFFYSTINEVEKWLLKK